MASTAEAAREFLKIHEPPSPTPPTHKPYRSYWKFMKKVCMLELLGGKMLHQLLHVRQQERKRFLSDLAKKGLAGEAVDIGAELMMLTNNVISMMAMRQKSCSERGGEMEALRKVGEDTVELSGKFNVSDFLWFMKGVDIPQIFLMMSRGNAHFVLL
ncbi:cytochrome P450 93A3-like [Arachis stenosperma]|uniref:cytochrome P450 93A3-like n=1 Tax=Arachis stenosperma TaxID=217475 RepID=UPI0025ACC143|nr:cytochrome P450 93A3-like [Arachis stenosperma]